MRRLRRNFHEPRVAVNNRYCRARRDGLGEGARRCSGPCTVRSYARGAPAAPAVEHTGGGKAMLCAFRSRTALFCAIAAARFGGWAGTARPTTPTRQRKKREHCVGSRAIDQPRTFQERSLPDWKRCPSAACGRAFVSCVRRRPVNFCFFAPREGGPVGGRSRRAEVAPSACRLLLFGSARPMAHAWCDVSQ